MFKMPHFGFLAELYNKKNLSDEEKRKLSVTSSALSLIAVSIGTEGSSHKLSEEMDKLEDYVAKIESTLK